MMDIRNGECIEELATLEDNIVDLVLTDPPYNLANFMNNRDTNLHKMRDNFFATAGWDDLEFDDWKNHMDLFFKESSRILKPGGSMIIFMSILRVETLVELASKYGFYYKTTGIWHKTNPMPRNMNLHFVNSNECWIYFTYMKRTGVFNNNGKLELDFIKTSVAPLSEKRHGKHPTQKPIELFEHFVRLLSNEGDLVVDPFLGSGSSAVASYRLNRKFIGIELERKYYELAKKRLNDEEKSN